MCNEKSNRAAREAHKPTRSMLEKLLTTCGRFTFLNQRLIKAAFFFLFLFTMTACNCNERRTEQFKAVDFSYFDTSPEAFSLRVTSQDSVFIIQHFSSHPEEPLKDSTVYFGLLKGNLKKQFDSLIAVTNFSKLESVYETGHIDGDEYQLYIDGDTFTKQVYVHSRRAPQELESLKNLFINLTRNLVFVRVDTTINFRVNPPDPPVKQSSSR